MALSWISRKCRQWVETIRRFVTKRCLNHWTILWPILRTHFTTWSGTTIPQKFTERIRTNYSHGVAQTREEVELNEKRMETWVNPLEARLPIAPHMRIYCLYGVGNPTERSYWYYLPCPYWDVKVYRRVIRGFVPRRWCRGHFVWLRKQFERKPAGHLIQSCKKVFFIKL